MMNRLILSPFSSSIVLLVVHKPVYHSLATLSIVMLLRSTVLIGSYWILTGAVLLPNDAKFLPALALLSFSKLIKMSQP